MPANLESAAVATGLEKVSFHSNSKDRQWQECSNYCTIALISQASVLAWRIPGMGSHRVRHDWSDLAAAAAAAAHASKVMCKILQARLQQYMNSELPDVKLVLEKTEELEIKLPTLAGSSKKQESSRKTCISALLTMPKPLTLWITINCGKFWKRWEYQTTWPASWETCMQVRKQQLELDIEQQTGSK